MESERLTAFSDGVVAIIITIMVLELKVPQGDNWNALLSMLPSLGGYILSYIFVGIYWNNHHHLLHMCRYVNAGILWANLHLLFWLSLIPLSTSWVDTTHLAALPTACYGVCLTMSAVAYVILQQQILRTNPTDTPFQRALRRDLKGKISFMLNLLGIAVAFVWPYLSFAIYIGVVILWLIPDRRIEQAILESQEIPPEAGKS